MKINVTNTAKLAAAISDTQGTRVRERLIDVGDIALGVQRAEKVLSSMMLKKDWVGVEVWVDLHAQKFPGAYKGVPASTKFRLQHEIPAAAR